MFALSRSNGKNWQCCTFTRGLFQIHYREMEIEGRRWEKPSTHKNQTHEHLIMRHEIYHCAKATASGPKPYKIQKDSPEKV